MDEVEVIRRHAPQVPPPEAERKRQARLALMTAAAAPRRRFAWRVARPRRRVLAALVVAVVAIGVARAGFVPPPDPAAASALHQASTVAADAEALVIGDGYVYTKIEALWGFYAADWMYLRPLVREDWMAADGSGRIRENVGELIFLSEADREAWEAGNFTPYALNEDFGPGGLEPFLANASLPTDVDLLREEVRQRAAASHPWPRTDSQMFVVIGDLLRAPLTPPAVRAALFQVAAGLPGIELLGEMADRIGRPGVAVAMTAFQMTPYHRQEIIIFDPATSVLLEERTVGLWPYGDTPAPITLGYATYLESAVVVELPAE